MTGNHIQGGRPIRTALTLAFALAGIVPGLSGCGPSLKSPYGYQRTAYSSLRGLDYLSTDDGAPSLYQSDNYNAGHWGQVAQTGLPLRFDLDCSRAADGRLAVDQPDAGAIPYRQWLPAAAFYRSWLTATGADALRLSIVDAATGLAEDGWDYRRSGGDDPGFIEAVRHEWGTPVTRLLQLAWGGGRLYGLFETQYVPIVKRYAVDERGGLSLESELAIPALALLEAEGAVWAVVDLPDGKRGYLRLDGERAEWRGPDGAPPPGAPESRDDWDAVGDERLVFSSAEARELHERRFVLSADGADLTIWKPDALRKALEPTGNLALGSPVQDLAYAHGFAWAAFISGGLTRLSVSRSFELSEDAGAEPDTPIRLYGSRGTASLAVGERWAWLYASGYDGGAKLFRYVLDDGIPKFDAEAVLPAFSITSVAFKGDGAELVIAPLAGRAPLAGEPGTSVWVVGEDGRFVDSGIELPDRLSLLTVAGGKAWFVPRPDAPDGRASTRPAGALLYAADLDGGTPEPSTAAAEAIAARFPDAENVEWLAIDGGELLARIPRGYISYDLVSVNLAAGAVTGAVESIRYDYWTIYDGYVFSDGLAMDPNGVVWDLRAGGRLSLPEDGWPSTIPLTATLLPVGTSDRGIVVVAESRVNEGDAAPPETHPVAVLGRSGLTATGAADRVRDFRIRWCRERDGRIAGVVDHDGSRIVRFDQNGRRSVSPLLIEEAGMVGDRFVVAPSAGPWLFLVYEGP